MKKSKTNNEIQVIRGTDGIVLLDSNDNVFGSVSQGVGSRKNAKMKFYLMTIDTPRIRTSVIVTSDKMDVIAFEKPSKRKKVKP